MEGENSLNCAYSVHCTKWVGANELNSFSNWVDSVPDSNNFQAAFTTNIIIIFFSYLFVFVLGLLFWQTHTKNTKYTVITNGNLCSVFGFFHFLFLFFFFFLFFIYGILPMLVFCLLLFSSEDLNYYIIVI